LNNEKRGGLKVVAFKVSLEAIHAEIFKQVSHPVRGLKLLSETCFCLWKSRIVFQQRYSVGGLGKNPGNLHWKKSRKLACHMVDSNIGNESLPILQISVGIIASFEKIYDGKPIFIVF
jgi:hypothetical protein